jgi:non-heme chloroperoxidase
MRTRISVSPGVELDVIQTGSLAGVPLLLLHGLSDSALSMAPLTDALPPQIRAIAVSQRGHGDSAKPQGEGYTTDALAADALCVLDRLGVRRAVVFGHSMGSVVAQRLAVSHPDRVAGLVLEGAFPGLKGNPAVEGFRAEIEALTDPIDPAFARGFQESTIARPLPAAFMDLITAESCKLPARAWRQILDDMAGCDTTGELSAVEVPALLLWGDRDGFVTRADQDRLLAALPQATLEVFEGTGHDPHWEEPARAARSITHFVLRQTAPADV